MIQANIDVPVDTKLDPMDMIAILADMEAMILLVLEYLVACNDQTIGYFVMILNLHLASLESFS